MQPHDILDCDLQFGSLACHDRLPLVRLRERRRELVLSLEGHPLTRERIREIAEVQQAIKAIEAVVIAD